MPPKNMENIENHLFFKDENGSVTSFKRIETVNIGDLVKPEMIEASPIDDMQFEINLKDIVPVDGLTIYDLFLVLFCGYDIEKVKQNNWRKMHGISMRRKIRK